MADLPEAEIIMVLHHHQAEMVVLMVAVVVVAETMALIMTEMTGTAVHPPELEEKAEEVVT